MAREAGVLGAGQVEWHGAAWLCLRVAGCSPVEAAGGQDDATADGDA